MSDIYCAQCEGRLVGAWRRSQLPSNQENNHMDPNETLKQLQIRHAQLRKEQRELVCNMQKIVDSNSDLTDKAKRLVELVLAFDKRCSNGS